ncbi:MAG: hypothetical protein QXE52_07990 [Candidatus Caldarchaeum sp.]
MRDITLDDIRNAIYTLRVAIAEMIVLEPLYIRQYGWPLAMAFAIYVGSWIRPPQADYVNGSVPWYWYVLLFVLIQLFGIFIGLMLGMIPIAGVWYWNVYDALIAIAVVLFLIKLSMFLIRLKTAIMLRINRFIDEEYDRARNPYGWQ